MERNFYESQLIILDTLEQVLNSVSKDQFCKRILSSFVHIELQTFELKKENNSST